MFKRYCFLQYILKINHQVKHIIQSNCWVNFDIFFPTSLLIRLDTVFKISNYNIFKIFCQLF